MALSFCDRVRALPKVVYHLVMMLASVGIIAAFGSYVVKAIHDDGFTYQTMYAMSIGVYIVPRFSVDVYTNANSLFEHIWFSLARWYSSATRFFFQDNETNEPRKSAPLETRNKFTNLNTGEPLN